MRFLCAYNSWTSNVLPMPLYNNDGKFCVIRFKSNSNNHKSSVPRYAVINTHSSQSSHHMFTGMQQG